MNDLSKRIADVLSRFPHGDLLQRTRTLLDVPGTTATRPSLSLPAITRASKATSLRYGALLSSFFLHSKVRLLIGDSCRTDYQGVFMNNYILFYEMRGSITAGGLRNDKSGEGFVGPRHRRQ